MPVASQPPAAEPPAPAPSPLLNFLGDAVRKGVSEVIVSANATPRCRVARAFVQMEATRFDDDEIAAVFSPEARAKAAAGAPVRVPIAVPVGDNADVRFMASLFRHRLGLGAVFRPVYRGSLDFAALGVPDEVRPLVEGEGGLVLIASGPGGGKSTLFGAVVAHLNSSRRRHIITLESPIEIEHTSAESLVHQRAVGVDVAGYAEGVRQALVAAPDVIALADVPDVDAARAVLRAAEAGNLVVACLDADSPVQAIERFGELFEESERARARASLGGSLAGIITVRLLASADGRAQVPAVEVVRIEGNLPNMVREGKLQQFDAQVGSTRRDGNLPLDAALLRLVKTRKITIEAARRVARDPKALSG